jgi:hypothetical protein
MRFSFYKQQQELWMGQFPVSALQFQSTLCWDIRFKNLPAPFRELHLIQPTLSGRIQQELVRRLRADNH